ncbi:hypothetical protein CASFOL_026774 [Castilleja foliolosa]|uniref:GATA-type domain-containing protein n=1 Tax=Castilleja foliolosa TaxID=1961234 RepID=A0ABD3CLS4_9LAMI
MVESNSSYSSISKRVRSKRARPSGLSPWVLMSPLFPAATKTRKARKKKLSQPLDAKKSRDLDFDHTITKRCSHCQATKTPQWREGPMGPKTLCNACGVRHRSGRLLPEYRPAASPTFVPSMHSNSHKKVVQIRNKAQKQQVTRIEQPRMSGCFFDSI